MAKSTFTKPALKRLGWLVVIIAVFAGVTGFASNLFGAKNATFIPQLGLDLQGGTSMILKPIYQKGGGTSADELSQAVDLSLIHI